MLHLIAIAAADVDPQERSFVEARQALLIEIDLSVMSICIIEKGLDHFPWIDSARLRSRLLPDAGQQKT
ncbi:hypothetical protein [Microvirga sp. HBU67558]|uniref:hypothetical protein n=1 Tax=Microvirga sp. HBU67558 TaxID=2824562 RepID=UPI001FFC2D94|nr:hypothetical protein [Microvirga sp. HBU67558]